MIVCVYAFVSADFLSWVTHTKRLSLLQGPSTKMTICYFHWLTTQWAIYLTCLCEFTSVNPAHKRQLANASLPHHAFSGVPPPLTTSSYAAATCALTSIESWTHSKHQPVLSFAAFPTGTLLCLTQELLAQLVSTVLYWTYITHFGCILHFLQPDNTATTNLSWKTKKMLCPICSLENFTQPLLWSLSTILGY